MKAALMTKGFIVTLALAGGLLLSGCSFKTPAPKPLSSFSQDPALYLASSYALDQEREQALAKDYLTRHLSPWSSTAPRENRLSAFWGLRSAKSHPGYGENRLPNSKEWIERLEYEMNEEGYPSLLESGIVTQDTDARVMPTHKPRFYDFKKAGEGYPFDYWQNSYLFSGTPVLITHATRDKEWLYVEASFVSGWVRSLAVARASSAFKAEAEGVLGWAIPLNDSIPLYDSQGEFLDRARLGKLYPIHALEGETLMLKVPKRGASGEAIWQESQVSRSDFAPFPLSFTPENGARLAAKLMGEKYGWGGMYGNRDCSAMVRDLVGSMGVWLPRNSAAQAKFQGGFVDLSALEPKEKESRILAEAIPWASLLYLKGHIMLYIGEHKGRAMVLHDAWGIRTEGSEGEGRLILGGVVITDLSVGEGVEGVKEKSLLLHRLEGFRNLLSPLEIKKP